MEPSVDTSPEDAIGWLVQIILGALLMDKLEAWIRQFGLADNIDRLKSEIRRVGMVVAAVKGRAIGNEQLAEILSILKELLYDADDVVDDLDYYMLQQQVQGVTRDKPEGMHGEDRVHEIAKGNADTPNSSVGKLRSEVWQHFTITEIEREKPVKAKCKICGREFTCRTDKNGTSSMKKHLENKHGIEISKKKYGANPPNTSSIGDATANATSVLTDDPSNRKRRRTDEGAAQTTSANIRTPWDKAELSSRIQKKTSQLHDTREEVNDFLKALGPDSVASSNYFRSTAPDQRLRTSSVIQRKMYGRAEETEFTIKLMTEHKPGGPLIVLPIVGIAGVGKTALAQLVYNDPAVESHFDHRIWVWVSNNFDATKLSTEMLGFVPQEAHSGLCSFDRSQEILRSHIKSKRVLLVLDDIWGDVSDSWWNQLLAPLNCENSNGNVILVTTRKLSVAKRVGTARPIKLGALENDDFFPLFKACAFGNRDYEGNAILRIIGEQIAKKLKGNPLAAVSAGALLRDDLTIDHWSNVLSNEDWKSMQLSGGIMPAFKLSYDQFPYHLKQCFAHCSIFPDSYQFLGEELVRFWISEGFVKFNHSNQRLEQIGQGYLTDLVNLGFFQQVEKEEADVGTQIMYSMCGLMHDFAVVVSRTECATIDGILCNKLLPTIHHLSIVTGSAYTRDQHGNIPRNKDFEENLRNAVTSVRNLRTLVLIGQYDSFFFQSFQDIFQNARNLRLLQISATNAGFNSLLGSLGNPTHLRYLKLEADEKYGALTQVLSKFYHLQVLDVGLNTDPTATNGMDKLSCLRHLVAQEGVHCSIGRTDEITLPLQSMNAAVELQDSQLENVITREVINWAGLRNKQHFERLNLYWTHTSLPSMDTANEVFEDLEPHLDLKHLRMSGYKGATSPIWLATSISVTSLKTLHLEDCGEWEILPSMERLPFLTKLELRNMRKVTEVWVPSLEELVLVEMTNLEICSSTPDLNYTLQVLKIKNCPLLKVFDLFGDNQKFKIEVKSRLPGVRKFTIRNCPVLKVLNPFPPSTTSHELRISGVSTFPRMQGSSSETLTIGLSDELRILDDKNLAFHSLTNLKSMRIHGCRNLTFIWFKGFSQLTSLKSLEIGNCENVFSWPVMPPGHTREDTTSANWTAFPSLEIAIISSSGTTGEWLSLMRRHAPALKKLVLLDRTIYF